MDCRNPFCSGEQSQHMVVTRPAPQCWQLTSGRAFIGLSCGGVSLGCPCFYSANSMCTLVQCLWVKVGYSCFYDLGKVEEFLISLLKMVLNSGTFEISILYKEFCNIVSLIHKTFLRGKWSHNLKEDKPRWTELFVRLIRDCVTCYERNKNA